MNVGSFVEEYWDLVAMLNDIVIAPNSWAAEAPELAALKVERLLLRRLEAVDASTKEEYAEIQQADCHMQRLSSGILNSLGIDVTRWMLPKACH